AHVHGRLDYEGLDAHDVDVLGARGRRRRAGRLGAALRVARQVRGAAGPAPAAVLSEPVPSTRMLGTGASWSGDTGVSSNSVTGVSGGGCFGVSRSSVVPDDTAVVPLRLSRFERTDDRLGALDDPCWWCWSPDRGEKPIWLGRGVPRSGRTA